MCSLLRWHIRSPVQQQAHHAHEACQDCQATAQETPAQTPGQQLVTEQRALPGAQGTQAPHVTMHSPSARIVPTSCRTCVLHSPVCTSMVKAPSASMECHEHDACAVIGGRVQPDPVEYDEYLSWRGHHNFALCPGTGTLPARLQSVSSLWCHHTCRCATIWLLTCRQSCRILKNCQQAGARVI
jgi:hypothetical protein